MQHNSGATARALAVLAVVAGIGVAGSSAVAQTPITDPVPLAQRTPPPVAMTTPASDLDFERMIAMANNGEIAAAREALRHSRNAWTRTFAQRMIDDHTTAAVALQAATRGNGTAPPPPATAVDPDAVRMIEMLRPERGAMFDADYMLGQISSHKKAQALLQWEIANGRVASLKDFATRTLPVVQMHLAMATAFVASNGTTLNAPGYPAVTPAPMPSMMPDEKAPYPPNQNPAAPSNGQSNQQNTAPGTMPQVGPSPPANVPPSPHPSPTGT